MRIRSYLLSFVKSCTNLVDAKVSNVTQMVRANKLVVVEVEYGNEL